MDQIIPLITLIHRQDIMEDYIMGYNMDKHHSLQLLPLLFLRVLVITEMNIQDTMLVIMALIPTMVLMYLIIMRDIR